MKREIYVFLDHVSQNYGDPFCMANLADLKREFQRLCENPAVPAYAIRDTLVLYLGDFYPDPVNPRIEALPAPITVIRGDSYNVDEIRGQSSNSSSSASQLPSV